MQHRYGSRSGRPSFDGFAIAKGWFTTVGLWLGSTLAQAIFFDVTRVGEADTVYLDNVAIWSMFAVVGILAAMAAGLPLALLLDRLLRGIRVPWIHVGSFFFFFTLLPAIPLWLSAGREGAHALGFCAQLGACAAIGRAAAFRRGSAFRRPTTWA